MALYVEAPSVHGVFSIDVDRACQLVGGCGSEAYLADNLYISVCGKHIKHRLKHLQLCPCILLLIFLQAQ